MCLLCDLAAHQILSSVFFSPAVIPSFPSWTLFSLILAVMSAPAGSGNPLAQHQQQLSESLSDSDTVHSRVAPIAASSQHTRDEAGACDAAVAQPTRLQSQPSRSLGNRTVAAVTAAATVVRAADTLPPAHLAAMHSPFPVLPLSLVPRCISSPLRLSVVDFMVKAV